jgi:hypothetical protein
MNARRRTLILCVLLVGGLLLHGALGLSQPPPAQPVPLRPPVKAPPNKMELIAETKLLMDGLARANFRGLEKILAQRPQEAQAWVFGRGQAQLLAETGNLLMLRPPRNEGEPVWYQRVGEFRSAAVQLANALGQKDYEKSRANLHLLANTCNRCHQTFRIAVQIKLFDDQLKVGSW